MINRAHAKRACHSRRHPTIDATLIHGNAIEPSEHPGASHHRSRDRSKPRRQPEMSRFESEQRGIRGDILQACSGRTDAPARLLNLHRTVEIPRSRDHRVTTDRRRAARACTMLGDAPCCRRTTPRVVDLVQHLAREVHPDSTVRSSISSTPLVVPPSTSRPLLRPPGSYPPEINAGDSRRIALQG